MAQIIQTQPNIPTPKSKTLQQHRQEYVDWSKQLLERAKKILRPPVVL